MENVIFEKPRRKRFGQSVQWDRLMVGASCCTPESFTHKQPKFLLGWGRTRKEPSPEHSMLGSGGFPYRNSGQLTHVGISSVETIVTKTTEMRDTSVVRAVPA